MAQLPGGGKGGSESGVRDSAAVRRLIQIQCLPSQMPPSDQVSLGLQRVVNASYRGPGPPTLSGYVPKFLPFFRISGYERLGADEGVGRTSIGISGLSRPAVGTRRRCGGGPRALFYRRSPFEEPVRGNLADDRGVAAGRFITAKPARCKYSTSRLATISATISSGFAFAAAVSERIGPSHCHSPE
jgi:hypothetical protein